MGIIALSRSCDCVHAQTKKKKKKKKKKEKPRRKEIRNGCINRQEAAGGRTRGRDG
jgi:hypothetical protein